MIYKNVKEICRERDINIGKLEKDCGLSSGYLSRKLDMPISKVKKIARYLNVSIDYLVYEDVGLIIGMRKLKAQIGNIQKELLELSNQRAKEMEEKE